jgi:Fe2+ transport system protein B
MDFNTELNESLKAFREVRLDKKSDGELVSMIKIFRQWQIAQFAGEAPQAIEAVEKEIARRQIAKNHQELVAEQHKLHQAQIAEAKLLSDTSDEKLKSSIDGLRKPHWTMTPGFVVVLLTMIFAAIAAWPVIREWLPDFQPVSKAASSQSQQSNSPPAPIAAQQMSLPAPGETQDTNHP